MKTANDIDTGIGIFYIPFAYLYHVRLRKVDKLLSWIGLLLLPTLSYFVFSLPDTYSTGVQIGSYILLWLMIVPYYELGYMYNDTYTTQHESAPSLRLNTVLTDYFYRHVGKIYLTRLVYVLCLLLAFEWLNSWSAQAVLAGGWTALLLPVFQVYNHIRGLKAVCLYPILVSWRYVPFLLYHYGSQHWWTLLAFLLLTYPIEISIERFSMPKHRYKGIRWLIPDEAAKQSFRVWYYAICIVVLSVICPLLTIPHTALLPFYALYLYRFLRLWKEIGWTALFTTKWWKHAIIILLTAVWVMGICLQYL